MNDIGTKDVKGWLDRLEKELEMIENYIFDAEGKYLGDTAHCGIPFLLFFIKATLLEVGMDF